MGWMPHGFCFLWQGKILWPMIITNVIIAASYLLIAISLWTIRGFVNRPYELIKTESKKINYALGSFGLFIFFCGCTHIMDIVVIYNPLYSLQILFLGLTAFFSGATAYWLSLLAKVVNQARKNGNMVEWKTAL